MIKKAYLNGFIYACRCNKVDPRAVIKLAASPTRVPAPSSFSPPPASAPSITPAPVTLPAPPKKLSWWRLMTHPGAIKTHNSYLTAQDRLLRALEGDVKSLTESKEKLTSDLTDRDGQITFRDGQIAQLKDELSKALAAASSSSPTPPATPAPPSAPPAATTLPGTTTAVNTVPTSVSAPWDALVPDPRTEISNLKTEATRIRLALALHGGSLTPEQVQTAQDRLQLIDATLKHIGNSAATGGKHGKGHR